MKLATALLLGLMLPISAMSAMSALAEPATGTPVVYHSPDGTGTPPSGTPAIDLENDQQLNLYIDYDNSPDVGVSSGTGKMCENEDGDETCGFDVLLKMTTDTATFGSFTPASAKIVGYIDPATRTTLRVNGVDINGMAIPAAIGTLTVDALDANQLQITVEGVHRVGAAGQLDAIQPAVVVVPEPGVELLLISGSVGLAALKRWRRRAAAA